MLAAQTMCPITTKFVEIRITLNNLPLKRLPNLSNSYPKHHTEIYIYIYPAKFLLFKILSCTKISSLYRHTDNCFFILT